MRRLVLLAAIRGWSFLFITAVLNASTPLFTALAGAALLGERLRRPQVVGLGIGLGGIGLVSARRPSPASTEAPPIAGRRP